MPVLTTVIDDKSPLVAYDTTWLPGSSWDDNMASNYYLGTFTTNNVTDGTVTFGFNGTAIWIYGANRPNHGSYTVQVDGATYTGYNGAGNNLFQESLFNMSSLGQETHTLTLTNTATGSLYVDIDMIVWESEIGGADDQLVSEIVQDTDPRFQYQEPAWATTSSTSNINLNMFNNGSGHITETYDSSVTFTFQGMLLVQPEAVSLFGTSGPSNGEYSVQLDGGQTVKYNATNAYPTNYGVMIHHADNLGSGSHQIVLTNLPASSGQILTVDYAQLWTTANTTTNGTSTPYPSSSTSNPQNNLSSGAIAGIAIAVAVAVLSAAAALFFYRRWKTALATQHNLYRVYTPQQRPPASTTVAPTGVSSSLETRSNASLLRNDNSTPASSGRAQQPAVQTASGSRDSQSIIDATSSPTQSPVDEGVGRRPLPDAPGGGLPLIAEFPKLAGLRRGQSVMTASRTSIAPSDAPPPNYNQATGNV